MRHPHLRTSFLLRTPIPCALLLAATTWAPPAHAGWVEQDSGTTAWLMDLDFVDASTGVVVGFAGTVRTTSDGGATWSTGYSGTGENLLSVDMVDASVGYAVGVNGIALKTTDGGATWSAQSSGTSNHLYAVQFPVDDQVGYAGGSSGTLLKTTDGGTTWLPLSIPTVAVEDIHFPTDSQHGWIVTAYGNILQVYATADGGATWTRQLEHEDAYATDVEFPAGATTGYVGSWGRVFETTDGGGSWSQSLFTTEMLWDLYFVDDQVGFGVGSRGTVLRTVDGGSTWIEGRTGFDIELRAVEFVDASTGWVVGRDGLIMRSDDGGLGNLQVAYLHPTSTGGAYDLSYLTGCAAPWDCVNDQPGNSPTGVAVEPVIISEVGGNPGEISMFALTPGIVPEGALIDELVLSVASTNITGATVALRYQRMGLDQQPIESSDLYAGAEWCCSYYDYRWTGLGWSPSDVDVLEFGLRVGSAPYFFEQLHAKVVYDGSPPPTGGGTGGGQGGGNGGNGNGNGNGGGKPKK